MPLINDRFDVVDMAQLSIEAYEDSFDVNEVSGWSALTQAQLFSSTTIEGSFQNGVYKHAYILDPFNPLAPNTAVALVARNGSDLVISFKGSTSRADFDAATNHQDLHFDALREVIEAALRYAADTSNNIAKVYITGHSLGGAMAEYLAAHIAEFTSIFPDLDKLQFITFGSPGVDATTATPSGLLPSQIEQIGHLGDPVFMQDTDQPGPLNYNLARLTQADNRISVDLPYVTDGYLDLNIFDPTVVPEHRSAQYLDSMYALAGSPLTDFADNSFYIAIGREEAHTGVIDTLGETSVTRQALLIGRIGREDLHGGTFNDLIDGGGGNDRLFGFGGNDILLGGQGGDALFGGSGTDTGYYGGGVRDGTGIVVNLADPTQNSGDALGDTYSSIENIFGTFGNDSLTGDAGTNVIDGGSGSDMIKGSGGDDILYGRAGKDRLMGGNGQDVLVGGSDQDALIGGIGADIFSLALPLSSGAGSMQFDIITDYDRSSGQYSIGEGDIIDLSNLLSTAYKGSNGASLVRLVALSDGSGAALQVDVDGKGTAATWHTVADLQGIGPGQVVQCQLSKSLVYLPYGVSLASMSAGWSISPIHPTVGESSGTLTFTVHRPTADVAETIYVTTTANHGYTNSGDFNDLASFALHFDPGVIDQQVTVTINDDKLVEADEIFGISLHSAPNLPNTSSLTSTIFTIRDDEKDTQTTSTSGDDVIFIMPQAGTQNYSTGDGNDRAVIDFHSLSTNCYLIKTQASAYFYAYSGPLLQGGYNYNVYTNAEAITFLSGSGNDTLIGGNFDDTLSGGAGNDNIYSAMGNDVILGGAGDDQIFLNGSGFKQVDAGTGLDTVTADLSSSAAPILVDLANLYVPGQFDIVNAEIINLKLGTGNDTVLVGPRDVGTSSIDGGAGVDGAIVDLSASSNDFQIFGSTPNFSIWENEQDIYALSSFENATFITGSGNDTVDCNNATLIATGAGDDAITGSNLSQVFTGDGNDTVDCNNATLIATGAGNDKISVWSTSGGIIDGGAGIDTLSLDLSSEGPVTLTNQTSTLPDGTQVKNVELLNLTTGDGADRATFIMGSPGTQSFTANSGGDTAVIDFRGETDNVVANFDGVLSKMYVLWALHSGESEPDLPYEIHTEAKSIGALDFQPKGLSCQGVEHFIIRSGSGNDTIFVGGLGGEAYGGAGNDTLSAYFGPNLLNGGSGNDILIGSSGNDILTGGIGNDTFKFATGFSLDTVTDFRPGTGVADVISLSFGTAFDTYAEVMAATTQVGADTVITIDASDTITLTGVLMTALVASDFSFY